MSGPVTTSLNLTPPVQVYIPSPSGRPSVFLQNTGRTPLWVGGTAVSTVGGLRLAPGAGLDLTGASQTLWAASGFTPGAALGTVTTNIAQGGSVITVASGGSAFTANSFLVIEKDGLRQEVAKVAASTGTTVTIATTFAYAHGSTVTFSAVLPAPALVTVEGGAT